VGKGIDLVVATGDFVDAFAGRADPLGDGLVVERDPVEAYRVARETLRGDETILLKGSRGDRMERWLPLLERDFGGAATAAAPGEG
jgi:UDP-N-acetylmuramyl pentapeptide synthase